MLRFEFIQIISSESSMFGLQPFNLKHEPSLTNMSSTSSLSHGPAQQSANHQETPSMEFDKLLFQTQFTPDNTTKSSNHNPVSIAETINSNARYSNLNSASNMNVPVSSSNYQSNPLENLDSGMDAIIFVFEKIRITINFIHEKLTRIR